MSLMRAAAIFASLLASLPMAPAHAATTRVDLAEADAQHPRTVTVRMRFEVSNTTAEVLEDGRFAAYVPVSETATQKLLYVESSHPMTLETDAVGNNVALFDLDKLAPRATAIIVVTAGLALSDAPLPMSLPDPRPYLAAERFIESDDPELALMAGKLRRERPADTAGRIYRWVADNIAYKGYTSGDRGAADALEQKAGDCSEMGYLFVALARAAGLPARFLGGFMTEGSALLTPTNYHNWAEFHDGETWKVADPQQRNFAKNPSRYIATNIGGRNAAGPLAGAHRFRALTGGLKVRMLGAR